MGHKWWRKDGIKCSRSYTITLKLWDKFHVHFVFLYIYVSEEIWHLYLKNVEKNKKVEHFRLLFTYLQQNLYSIKERFALVLKNFVNVFFCVFQIDLNKAVNIFCSLPDWIWNTQIQCFSTLKNCMRILNGLLKAWKPKNLIPLSQETLSFEGPTHPRCPSSFLY